MIVKLTTHYGAVLDVSRRVTQLQWSGDKGELARELQITLAVSDTDTDYATPEVGLFRPVGLYTDDGTLLMSGYAVKVSRDSGGNELEVTALDRGLWLANNQGFYNFPDTTPEDATRTLCGDFGIPVGTVPATAIHLQRKFPGVALHDILQTLWYLAGEQSGKQYHLGFVGQTLQVTERPLTATQLLAPKVNLYSSSLTRDVVGYHNTVALYAEDGTPIRTIQSDEANMTLEGRMQAVLTQAEGENAEQEARALLLGDEIKQSVTVTCAGDTKLVTGQAVQVQLTAAGVVGLFWIDSDTHTWKDGQYSTRLTLNFRNRMEKAKSGSEWKEEQAVTGGSGSGNGGASSSSFSQLIREAEKYLGYPYKFGGSTPATSFDCSGFVSWVFRASGVYPLKRTSAQGIFDQCSKVSAGSVQAGDLVFFTGTYNSGHPVSHIGIYAGDGQMIHAGNPIQYAKLNTAYWKKHFYAYGRLPI